MSEERDAMVRALRDYEEEIAHLRAQLTQAQARLAEWAHASGWATGHGDTLADMIAEMRGEQEEQTRRLRDRLAEAEEALRIATSQRHEAIMDGDQPARCGHCYEDWPCAVTRARAYFERGREGE